MTATDSADAAPSHGRIDRPPPAAARIDLPPDFGRRFMVFVDTEEEFDWTRPLRRDATSTASIAALPTAHKRLRAFGIVPSYLLDHPVATAPSAIEVLRPLLEAGECAVGAQLHPWVNPPHDEVLSQANSFAGNLPAALEAAKLATLTAAIATGFGRRPDVYRAGRYGIGPNTAALLEGAGYSMDCSVRPWFDYRASGGPDFTRRGLQPSWAGPAGTLVEVPLTGGFVGAARRLGPLLYRAAPLRGALARSGLVERVALTPEGMPATAATALIRGLLSDGARLLTISFHSPSLEPGHTPYVRDAADLARFYAWWDEVLDLLAREGVAPASAAEVLDAAWSTRRAGDRDLAPAGTAPLSRRRARRGL